METKTIEIRDRATFIPAMATKMSPACEQDRYLFARSGFGRFKEQQSSFIWLSKIQGGEGQSSCDPYDWGSRSMQVAHDWIQKHWDEFESGDVIDVEFILGETKTKKRSEALAQYKGEE